MNLLTWSSQHAHRTPHVYAEQSAYVRYATFTSDVVTLPAEPSA
jgi:hypothetical protein